MESYFNAQNHFRNISREFYHNDLNTNLNTTIYNYSNTFINILNTYNPTNYSLSNNSLGLKHDHLKLNDEVIDKTSSYIQAFLVLTDTVYAYCKFWGRLDSILIRTYYSYFLVYLVMILISIPIIKPVIFLIYYIIKSFFLCLMFILCFIFNRKSSYYTNVDLINKTFRRLIYRNFYKHKSNKNLTYVSLVVYIIFLCLNLSFFILFLIDLKDPNSHTKSFLTAPIGLQITKFLTTYFHFFMEMYIILYFLIDNNNHENQLFLNKKTDHIILENETLPSYLSKLRESNKSNHNEKLHCYSPIAKKLIYSLVFTLAYMVILFIIALVISLDITDFSTEVKYNNLFFICFKILNISLEGIFIYLYCLVVVKFFNYSTLKSNWQGFFKVKNNYAYNYHTNATLNKKYYSKEDLRFEKNLNDYKQRFSSIQNDPDYESTFTYNSMQYNNFSFSYENQNDSNIDDHYEMTQINKVNNFDVNYSLFSLTALEENYLNKKYKQYEESKNDPYSTKKGLKLPEIKYYEPAKEIDIFYNTRSKFYYYKYLKYISFPCLLIINIIFICNSTLTLLFGTNSHLSDSLFSFIIIRCLSLLQSVCLFFNSWIIFMKIELRKIWLGD